MTVIDVRDGKLQLSLTVITEGERIAAIGSKIAIPRNALRLNGRGELLIVGLWDMHAHHQGAGQDSLDLFVAKGVVGTRDMRGPDLRAREGDPQLAPSTRRELL